MHLNTLDLTTIGNHKALSMTSQWKIV